MFFFPFLVSKYNVYGFLGYLGVKWLKRKGIPNYINLHLPLLIPRRKGRHTQSNLVLQDTCYLCGLKMTTGNCGGTF